MDQLTKEILIESGVHFGHPTQKWNPGFKDYIAGQKKWNSYYRCPKKL